MMICSAQSQGPRPQQPQNQPDPELLKSLRPTPDRWETPTGAYEVVMEVDPTLPEHTIYRPKNLDAFSGKNKLGVVLMSGPGCNYDGSSFRPFWTEVASHGYIVIAMGKPLAEGNRPILWYNNTDDYLVALNWIKAEAERKGSIYRNKADVDNVALFGQSCGAIQALRMADMDGIATLVFWNSGSILMGNVGPTDNTKRLGTDRDLMGSRDLRGILLSLDIPIAYFIGDTDMAMRSAKEDYELIEKAPVFYGVRRIPGDSHAGTFREKNGGAFGEVAVDWLDWTVKGDRKAKVTFETGNLEKDPDWLVSLFKD